MPSTITQTISIPADRAKVYDALTQSSVFSAVSGGAPTEIDAREGGKISLFDGRIVGMIIDLQQGERMVQAWRPTAWESGKYSLVRFELSNDNGGTRIALEQCGHPEAATEHLSAGWEQMYWAPLRAHFS